MYYLASMQAAGLLSFSMALNLFRAGRKGQGSQDDAVVASVRLHSHRC